MSNEPFRHTRRREVRARMWAGSTDDLTRLFEVTAGLQADARARARIRWEAEEETKERNEYDKQLSFLTADERDQRWMEHKEKLIGRRLDRLGLSIEMTLKHDEEMLNGSRSDVMDHLEDPTAVRQMTVMLGNFVPTGYSPPENGFRMTFDSTGARASTYGPDEDWVTLTEAKIAKAFNRARPKYAVLRGGVQMWALPFIASATAGLLLFAFGGVQVSGDVPWNWFGFGVQLGLTALLMIALSAVVSRSIPKFEVYDAGGTARGARNVRRGLAGLGVLITAVLVPVILKFAFKV